MTQSHNKASTSPRTSLSAPLRSSDNTGRLSAGQYGVVVPLLSGGRQCVLCATGYLLDCVSYLYVFQKNPDVDGEIFII
jgi:hypothetical protein